jgi:hypothetical protein
MVKCPICDQEVHPYCQNKYQGCCSDTHLEIKELREVENAFEDIRAEVIRLRHQLAWCVERLSPEALLESTIIASINSSLKRKD